MKPIRKIANHTFNDGILTYGEMKEAYDRNNNALDTKPFISIGRLHFSYETIREQDKYKYDTDKFKVSLKIKVMNDRKLRSNHIVNINNIKYSIAHIDYDNKNNNNFLYLTEFKDTLDKHIDIYIKEQIDPFIAPKEIFYRKIWASITTSFVKSNKSAKKETFLRNYTVIMKSDPKILEMEKNGSLQSVIMCFKNTRLMIDQMEVKNLENGLYELTLKEI